MRSPTLSHNSLSRRRAPSRDFSASAECGGTLSSVVIRPLDDLLEIRCVHDPVQAYLEGFVPWAPRWLAAGQELRLGTVLEKLIPPFKSAPLRQFLPPSLQ